MHSQVLLEHQLEPTPVGAVRTSLRGARRVLALVQREVCAEVEPRVRDERAELAQEDVLVAAARERRHDRQLRADLARLGAHLELELLQPRLALHVTLEHADVHVSLPRRRRRTRRHMLRLRHVARRRRRRGHAGCRVGWRRVLLEQVQRQTLAIARLQVAVRTRQSRICQTIAKEKQCELSAAVSEQLDLFYE